MGDKFLGLGLANIFGLFILFCILLLITKVVANKYPKPGITDVVNTI